MSDKPEDNKEPLLWPDYVFVGFLVCTALGAVASGVYWAVWMESRPLGLPGWLEFAVDFVSGVLYFVLLGILPFIGICLAWSGVQREVAMKAGRKVAPPIDWSPSSTRSQRWLDDHPEQDWNRP